MAKRRKTYTMQVTVTAPAGMPAAAIRREVRSLITHQANWSADPDDIKARSVVGLKAEGRPRG